MSKETKGASVRVCVVPRRTPAAPRRSYLAPSRALAPARDGADPSPGAPTPGASDRPSAPPAAPTAANGLRVFDCNWSYYGPYIDIFNARIPANVFVGMMAGLKHMCREWGTQVTRNTKGRIIPNISAGSEDDNTVEVRCSVRLADGCVVLSHRTATIIREAMHGIHSDKMSSSIYDLIRGSFLSRSSLMNPPLQIQSVALSTLEDFRSYICPNLRITTRSVTDEHILFEYVSKSLEDRDIDSRLLEFLNA